MFKLPVKLCVSSMVSPNCVEPLEKTIEAEVNDVWNSCAVSVPVTVASPNIVKSPVVVKEPVISTLPLIPVEVYFVVDVPICKSPVDVIPPN